jgi:hypothetical protein
LRHIVFSALAVTGLALFAANPAPVGQTEAAWVDTMFANGTLTAAIIPAPIMEAPCDLTAGLGGSDPVITINWHFPAGTSYAVPSNIVYFVSKGGLLNPITDVILPSQNLTTTGPVSGTYTTKVRSGLLGSLLGGTYAISLQTKDASGWTSRVATANAGMSALGLTKHCDLVPPPA